jgi:hypothetical protein
VSLANVRRERRAVRRRILAVLAERRLDRQADTDARLVQASISSTERMPTDS